MSALSRAADRAAAPLLPQSDDEAGGGWNMPLPATSIVQAVPPQVPEKLASSKVSQTLALSRRPRRPCSPRGW